MVKAQVLCSHITHGHHPVSSVPENEQTMHHDNQFERILGTSRAAIIPEDTTAPRSTTAKTRRAAWPITAVDRPAVRPAEMHLAEEGVRDWQRTGPADCARLRSCCNFWQVDPHVEHDGEQRIPVGRSEGDDM